MDRFYLVMLGGGSAWVFCRIMDSIWPTADKTRELIGSAVVTIVFTIAISVAVVAP